MRAQANSGVCIAIQGARDGAIAPPQSVGRAGGAEDRSPARRRAGETAMSTEAKITVSLLDLVSLSALQGFSIHHTGRVTGNDVLGFGGKAIPDTGGFPAGEENTRVLIRPARARRNKMDDDVPALLDSLNVRDHCEVDDVIADLNGGFHGAPD